MSMPTDSPDRHYLREWREKRGLLQDQLAKMVGSSASVISRFETGERGMKIEM
jgi:transcriptional regulator with XRE-family HTH domain